MKTIKIFTVIIFGFLFSNTSIAQSSKTDTIKVWGNCGMCKKKIEKAAKSAGATSADWNSEKQLMIVKYSSDKTSNSKIQESIAKSGYDTQDFTADQTAYDNLPGCCMYDRKKN